MCTKWEEQLKTSTPHKTDRVSFSFVNNNKKLDVQRPPNLHKKGQQTGQQIIIDLSDEEEEGEQPPLKEEEVVMHVEKDDQAQMESKHSTKPT